MNTVGLMRARPRDDVRDDGSPRRPENADRPVTVLVEALTKSYGPVKALDGVSFECHAGEILGVLGPNGAGKTTLVEILEGLRRPDAGRAEIMQVDVRDADRMRQVRDRVGVAMQRTELQQRLTVEELLRIYGSFYATPRSVDELVDRLGLAEKRRTRAGRLSGGQLQRLAVGLALVGRPSLLFLDEPTSQLDPQSRRAVWELVEETRAAGATIILTTHQMDEAEQLSTRIAVLDHGRLLGLGTPAELIERHTSGCVVRFVTEANASLDPLGPDRTTELLASGQRAVSLRTDAVEPTLERLLAARAAGRLPVTELRIEQKTLEDVFIALTGGRIRD
jgi:ABC-2 type transport system ATP-binding protein